MIANPTFSVKAAYAKSKIFKASLFITLATILLGVLFTFIGVFSLCVTYNSNSCSYYYRFNTNDCEQFNVRYCCGETFSQNVLSCGTYSNCYIKPFYYNVCMGELITAWTLFSIGCLSAVCSIVTFCYLKSKSKQFPGPYYQNLIYPNYPVYNQQPQNNWAPSTYLNYPNQIYHPGQMPMRGQKKQNFLNQNFTQTHK